MDESRRRRVGRTVVVGLAVLFGAMAGVAALTHQKDAAWQFATTGVILLGSGLLTLAVRAKADGPWWNRPVRVTTRRQLLVSGAFMLVSLFIVFLMAGKLIGMGGAAIETGILGVVLLAGFVFGWRRIGTS